MIITQDNYTEIQEIHDQDIVIFDLGDIQLEYKVRSRWMYWRHHDNETLILQLLHERNLISNTPLEFCSEAYGYPAVPHQDSNTWPDCRDKDYPALLRVIVAIYETISGKGTTKIELIDTPKISFL